MWDLSKGALVLCFQCCLCAHIILYFRLKTTSLHFLIWLLPVLKGKKCVTTTITPQTTPQICAWISFLSLLDIYSRPKDLGWVNSLTASRESVFSSELCISSIFIKMYISHWLEKNVLPNKGFHNSMTKIYSLTVKSQWYNEILALWVLVIVYVKERSL